MCHIHKDSEEFSGVSHCLRPSPPWQLPMVSVVVIVVPKKKTKNEPWTDLDNRQKKCLTSFSVFLLSFCNCISVSKLMKTMRGGWKTWTLTLSLCLDLMRLYEALTLCVGSGLLLKCGNWALESRNVGYINLSLHLSPTMKIIKAKIHISTKQRSLVPHTPPPPPPPCDLVLTAGSVQ